MMSVSTALYNKSGSQQKSTRYTKTQEKTQSEEKKQPSQPDSNMTQMLELKVWAFKITMINMLKALQNKVDNMQD